MFKSVQVCSSSIRTCTRSLTHGIHVSNFTHLCKCVGTCAGANLISQLTRMKPLKANPKRGFGWLSTTIIKTEDGFLLLLSIRMALLTFTSLILLFGLSQSQHTAVVKLTATIFCNWLSYLAGARAILPEETPLVFFLFSGRAPGSKRQEVGAS